MKTMVLLGAPGAGKGTLSHHIKDTYNAIQVSTGDLLREAIANGSDAGKTAKSYMDKGQLVPIEIVGKIMKDALEPYKDSNIIFDGFPRSMEQAHLLDDILKDLGASLNCILNIKIDDEEAVRRISGRLSCPSDGAVYNIYAEKFKPKTENRCDHCGTELTKRSDDNESTVRDRLKTYHDNNDQLVEYYRGNAGFFELDGVTEIGLEKEASEILLKCFK